MPVNDFARLSPADFEELTADLLGAAWAKRLERFTAGRDRGIDLRCFTVDGATIVQCKHTPGSSFSSLLSVISRLELPKIKVLNPSRYVLVTSVGLTPGNKKTLFDLLSPYVKSEDDILGREQINDLIRQFPDVEVANFKLWFTSAAVLQRVLHNAQAVQTEFEVDRIADRIPLFVQSESYPRACKILDDKAGIADHSGFDFDAASRRLSAVEFHRLGLGRVGKRGAKIFGPMPPIAAACEYR